MNTFISEKRQLGSEGDHVCYRIYILRDVDSPQKMSFHKCDVITSNDFNRKSSFAVAIG